MCQQDPSDPCNPAPGELCGHRAGLGTSVPYLRCSCLPWQHSQPKSSCGRHPAAFPQGCCCSGNVLRVTQVLMQGGSTHIGVGPVAADKGWKINCSAIRRPWRQCQLCCWPLAQLIFGILLGLEVCRGRPALSGEFGQLVSPFPEPQVISGKSRLAIS